MVIRPVRSDDAAAITQIYNHYIANTEITFEEECISQQVMQGRIDAVVSAKFPWLVVEEDQQVVGYAYAHLWRERSAYRFSVEPSIYFAPTHTGLGYGKQVYSALLKLLQQMGMRNVIGVITYPNEASCRLHEALGFRQVGIFDQVGFKHGRWLSVANYQLVLPSA
ncbi:GNAT family N-acetyltransferase [Vibrio porteresiae]|uniref:N-acetyltransferase family protein n=1 Tax=Vibrio porteresiae DSM 19223 TaxID=1123496 RepID=A0ABZ0QAZ4_9VIBR|nr:GNAT family N-acetyltransferase [Vibrio porteresiae]WPC72723.1 N-acetyltransferase family protein [Vibrio porteresiae DSM 19223]